MTSPASDSLTPDIADVVDGVGVSPTDAWLAAVPGMPPLEGPAGVAERLLLLLHYGVDWDSWVGRKRGIWWSDIFPDRVIAATYRCATLRRWWPEVADEIMSAPRTRAQRMEVERLLRADSQPVLEVLRFEVEPLLLRTRIVADAVREARPTWERPNALAGGSAAASVAGSVVGVGGAR